MPHSAVWPGAVPDGPCAPTPLVLLTAGAAVEVMTFESMNRNAPGPSAPMRSSPPRSMKMTDSVIPFRVTVPRPSSTIVLKPSTESASVSVGGQKPFDVTRKSPGVPFSLDES
jgi:hypothetical protein